MKKIIAALTLVMVSQTALAAEWYLVETTKNAFFFVDKSSLSKKGAKVKFWEWSVRIAPTGNPAYDNSKVLKVADCKDRTIKLEQFKFFYGEDLVDGGAPSSDVTQQVMPDSAVETIYQTVCSGKFTGKPIPKMSVEEIQTLMANIYAEQPKR